MSIEEVNRKINECIDKYDLEGHETGDGGMVWFAISTQTEKCKSINEHIEKGTYSFTTPPFNGHNAEDIYKIIVTHSDKIDQIIQVGS